MVHAREIAMADVAYRSQIRLERIKGPIRKAWMPSEAEPVTFGTHGAVAAHYGHGAGSFEPHATTIDYVVASAAG
jgi:hypothetical protein